jgi:chorismate synthase
VAEAVVVLELANALLEKTGGDAIDEVHRNLRHYLDGLRITPVPGVAAEPGAAET